MEKYPILKKGVMIYREDRKTSFLLNPYHASPQKLSRLDDNEAVVLKKLTGNNKIKEISRSINMVEKDVLRIIKGFSSKELSAVELLDRPFVRLESEQAREARYYKISRSVRQEFVSVKKATENSELIKKYHREEISDAMEQFNKAEMTVSHVYREPHALLHGRNYGSAFADALIKKRAVRNGISILEVGGGTGIFGKSFLDEIKKATPAVYKNIKYTFFELSRILLESQRKMSRVHRNIVRFIEGDIEKHNFRDEKFDLIISNEMIADLNVVKLRKVDFGDPSGLTADQKRAVDIINEYEINISGAPKEFLFNLKAIEFLIHIKEILNRGGKAYIVEYGNRWGYPRAVYLKGHVEYTIHFGFLEQIAQKLYLHPKLTCLTDFLHFDKNIKVVDRISRSVINNYLLPFLNRKGLSKMVYTEEMIKEEIGNVFNNLFFVSFSNVGSESIFLNPGQFLVLELEA